MKFNSKNLLIFLAVIAFIALASFAVSSKKPILNNSGNEVSTPSSEVGEEINLEITSPKDGEVVTKSPVLVSGTTVGGADVSVNDAEAKADANGDFKVSIPLEEGENEIFVVVNDSEGNYAEGSVKITLNTE
jgi:membrane-associated protease RseP (regulator of RpoE activity)